jgi:hypothetical protein
MNTNEGAVSILTFDSAHPTSDEASDSIVSTHVLVPLEQLLRLRELSHRTRVAQSEYLREAVDDLLKKYGCLPSNTK